MLFIISYHKVVKAESWQYVFKYIVDCFQECLKETRVMVIAGTDGKATEIVIFKILFVYYLLNMAILTIEVVQTAWSGYILMHNPTLWQVYRLCWLWFIAYLHSQDKYCNNPLLVCVIIQRMFLCGSDNSNVHCENNCCTVNDYFLSLMRFFTKSHESEPVS